MSSAISLPKLADPLDSRQGRAKILLQSAARNDQTALLSSSSRAGSISTSSLPAPSDMYISVRKDFAVLIGRQLNALSPVVSSLLDTIFWGSPVKSVIHIALFSIGSYYQMTGLRFMVVLFWVHVFFVAAWTKVSEGAASTLPGACSPTLTVGSPTGSVSAASNAPRMSPAEMQQCLRAYKVLTINAGRLIRRYPAVFNRSSSFWMCVTILGLFFDLVVCGLVLNTSLFNIIDCCLAPVAACTIAVCYGLADPRHTLTYNVQHQHTTMPARADPGASIAASAFEGVVPQATDDGTVDANTVDPKDSMADFRASMSSAEPGTPSMALDGTSPQAAPRKKGEMSYLQALSTIKPFAPNATPDGIWDTPASSGGCAFPLVPTVPIHVHKIFNILMRGPEWQVWKTYSNTKEYRKFCPRPHTVTKGSAPVAPRCDPSAALPGSYTKLLDAVLEYNEVPPGFDKEAARAKLQRMRAEANQKEEANEVELQALGHVVPWSVVKCSYNCLRIRCPSLPSAPTTACSTNVSKRFSHRGLNPVSQYSTEEVYKNRRLFQHVVDWLDDDDGAVDSAQLNVYQYDKLLGDYRRLKFSKFVEPLNVTASGKVVDADSQQEGDEYLSRCVRMRVVHYLYKQLVFAVAPRDAPVFTTATEIAPHEAAHYKAFGEHRNTFFPYRIVSKKALLALETNANVMKLPAALASGPQGSIYHVCSAETSAPAVPGHVRTNIHRQAFIVIAPPLRRHVVFAEYCADEGLALPPQLQQDMLVGLSSTALSPEGAEDDTDGEDQVVLVVTMICGEPGGRVPASVAEIGRGEQVKIVNSIKDKLFNALSQAL